MPRSHRRLGSPLHGTPKYSSGPIPGGTVLRGREPVWGQSPMSTQKHQTPPILIIPGPPPLRVTVGTENRKYKYIKKTVFPKPSQLKASQ